jgi:hypothetical protein
MNIYKKLLAAQKEIKGLGKDATSGTGNFGYKYVTGAKVLEAIKPILNEQGLILKQEIVKVENERIDYNTKNGSKSEMLYKVWQKFTWIDTDTGDKDENEFFSAGQNDWEKGLGSALTYAERYFLLKYFHIATDEDDIDNSERKAKEEEQDKKAASKKMDVCIKYLTEFVGDDVEKFEKVISHMNKTFKSEYKGFNQFKLEELESYIEALKKKGGK